VGLLCSLVNVYFIVLVARIILSWFPVTPGTALASIASILYDLTEPVLGPLPAHHPPGGHDRHLTHRGLLRTEHRPADRLRVVIHPVRGGDR
jgi:hypothetical protein